MNTVNQKEVVMAIRNKYEVAEQSKVESLKKLDKKAKLPAEIFAYSFGIVGALVLGVGMCLAMKVLGNSMALGIIVGVVGIAMVSVNYFIYKKLLASGKRKYAKKVLGLADEILGK